METPEKLRLTPAQRLHFDIYGYVLLEEVLTADEIGRMKEAVYRMNADPDVAAKRVIVKRPKAHFTVFENIIEYDPALFEYAVHPKLVPLVEDVVGGSVRLEESVAIVSRRDPEADLEALRRKRYNMMGFHSGTKHGWGTYIEQNRFHCLFTKTLAYLTDVGPDDGGTTMIPGSHRTSWLQKEMVEAALSDDALVRQIEARAGSVLLFAESLIHSSTAIRSDTERIILPYGYTPPMMREWTGHETSPEFARVLPDEQRRIISGTDNWRWRRHYEK